MDGVVSLLDPEATARVRALWVEIEARHGISSVAKRVPFPHISHHVAARYDLPTLGANLLPVGKSCRAFEIQTAGLGVFTGPAPVLTIAVTRSPALSAVHARAWAASGPAAEGSLPYYAPDRWVPHITIAQLDLTPEKLGPLMADLAGRDFNWTITLDAFTALIEDDGGYLHALRVPFGA